MKTLLVILVLFLSVCGMAQPYSSKNEKAVALYEEAKNLFINKNFDEAQKKVGQAIKRDSNFVEAFYLLAGTYSMKGDADGDIAVLVACAKRNGLYFPTSYYILGAEQLNYGRYADAVSSLEQALDLRHLIQPAELTKIETTLAKARFALKLFNNPVPYNPINLGSGVNSQYDDYLPALTADEEEIIVTSRIPFENAPPPGVGNPDQEDFYVSTKENGVWGPRRNLGPPLNTMGNEGAQTMTADGHLFFFTACDRRDGLGSCDLYYSVKRNDKWIVPRNLDRPVNSRYWESQPSVSADGRTLYFVSNKPGGYGGMDIYESHLDTSGRWTSPRNLGDRINTPKDDMAPFIHPDGKTLYFASAGHDGMGGTDIFVSRKDARGNWGEPMNLGYPINTWKDETDLRVNARGNMALISSDRPGGYGRMDLYQFELYPEARPQEVTYVKGSVFDANTKLKLRAAFELIDLQTGDIVIRSYSDALTGQFLVPLAVGKNFGLNVAKEGYLFHSEHFEVNPVDSTQKALSIDIPLQPIEVGKKIVLHNVFFDSDSYTLKDESKAELLKLVGFMQQNPTVKVEVSGHTDNTGGKLKNQPLSENRAKAVFDFLLTKGIVKDRLSYKGYGDTQPLVPNDNDKNKALNRRTECKITER